MKFEQYARHHLETFVPGKRWNYEDGCVMMGSIMLYRITGDTFYKDFVRDYVDRFVDEAGVIHQYSLEEYNIDSINSGKALYFLYEETGEEKYRRAIELLMDQLRSHPRTKSGNFWHKKIYPWQIWLDGLYMAQPFYMAYETKFHKKENYNDIISQFRNVRRFLFDEEKQLYYHGYDESREQPWCDPVTGCSHNFWLRAMGWYLIALIDTMDEMSDQIYEHYHTLKVLFQEAVKGILQYQDPETKLFWQVIDHPEVENNYTETSGSAMVAYAILKGCRMEALNGEKYASIGEEILMSLHDRRLEEVDGVLKLGGICSVAGLGPGDNGRDGSIAYYLSEAVVSDDHKGSGAFLMAYAQLLLYKQSIGEDISRLITIL